MFAASVVNRTQCLQFTDCFRETFFLLPHTLMLTSFTIVWLSDSPWTAKHVKRPMTTFQLIKASPFAPCPCCSRLCSPPFRQVCACALQTALPLVRLLIRAFEFSYTRPGMPPIMCHLQAQPSCSLPISAVRCCVFCRRSGCGCRGGCDHGRVVADG
jgi:hypothetical protein